MSYPKEIPLLRFIKAGTLESSWLKIDSTFFTKSAREWDAPNEDIKCCEGNPDIMTNIKSVIKPYEKINSDTSNFIDLSKPFRHHLIFVRDIPYIKLTQETVFGCEAR